MTSEEKKETMLLPPNKDLSYHFRSCETEVLKPLHGTKTGHIPSWLNGTLLLNGPGSLKVGDMEFKHVFDSSALLRRFHIANGEITFQCRFLQSRTYQRNQKAQKIVVNEFGTSAVPDPCHGIFDRFSALFTPGEGMSDNAMISVYPFGDEFYTFTESPIIHRIDPETLETTKRLNVYDHVSIVSHTSHPHVMKNGDVFNVGLSVTKSGLAYTVVRFPYTKKGDMFASAVVEARVPAQWRMNPGYMHTFGITENYFIIIEQPLAVSLLHSVKAQLFHVKSSSCLKWYMDYKTLFHVVRRSDGQIARTFQADTFFYFHIINQYEQDGHIIIDICTYKDASIIDAMYLESIKKLLTEPRYPNVFGSVALRFALPLTGDKVTLPSTEATAFTNSDNFIHVIPEKLFSGTCELPRINYENYMGKPYRYFYAVTGDIDQDSFGGILKIDTKEKTEVLWYEDDCILSEPIFIQKPDSKGEDDGVILSTIIWGKDKENDVGLLVLDALTFTELGRTIFSTPSPVPKCLHGWFHHMK